MMSQVFAKPEVVNNAGAEIARRAKLATSCRISVVVGPAHRGAFLATAVALNLMSLSGEPLALYTLRGRDGKPPFTLEPECVQLVRKRNVLVVDDVLTTGNSARETVATVRKAGGTVIGVATVVNRSKMTAEALGVPHLITLEDFPLRHWGPEICQLCRKATPFTEFGEETLTARLPAGHHPV